MENKPDSTIAKSNGDDRLTSDQIRVAVDELYRRACADARLNHFYEGVDMKRLMRMQTAFLESTIGPTDSFRGRDLVGVHKPLVDRGLGEAHFEIMAEHLAAALESAGADQRTISIASDKAVALQDAVLKCDNENLTVASATPKLPEKPKMKRIAFFAYGLVCYTIFLGVFAYAVPFIGGFLLPGTLDSGQPTGTMQAVIINLALLSLFALQHSVMARPTFKHWWTKIVPQPIERATYVLATNVALILMFWQWRPIEGVIWNISEPGMRFGLYGLFATGWGIVFVSTLLINHFDLFGMRQVWLYLRGREYTSLPFKTPLLYKHIRHPLYFGWILAFWATPTMTAGHLLFALVTTAYLFVAIQFEERNLVEHFGATYQNYRRQVPMIFPVPGKRAEDSAHAAPTAA